uniref:FIP-RBD domain-containing protein n=1 Tax=Graphocephala atropunctata TaxID=36148 RepID=A0A1B6KX96_9HEMI
MSVSEDEGPQELEFDMWEGQFEFVGGSHPLYNGNSEQDDNGNQGFGQNGYDPTVDLFETPRRRNGFKKHNVQLWYEDLAGNVQMLQQQMSVLADNQTNTDERYTRAKQDNATLQARVMMLEEQLREVELRSEDRLAEEERRHRELVARVDREKQLQVENCAIRLQTLELENTSLREEAARCRAQAERLRAEKTTVTEQLGEAESIVSSLQDEVAALRDQERRHKECAHANQLLVEELTLEVDRLRLEIHTLQELNQNSREPQTQLQAQLDSLRQEHRSLQEAHEELQAMILSRGVEEGRNLLSSANESHSLAAELDDMSQDDIRSAYKESQEVISHLRSYIDGILLLIVENCPRLLEVKPADPAP